MIESDATIVAPLIFAYVLDQSLPGKRDKLGGLPGFERAKGLGEMPDLTGSASSELATSLPMLEALTSGFSDAMWRTGHGRREWSPLAVKYPGDIPYAVLGA